MAKKLTVKQLESRGHALQEVAEHLDRAAWTDDQEERDQGVLIAKTLFAKAEACFVKAAQLERDIEEVAGNDE